MSHETPKLAFLLFRPLDSRAEARAPGFWGVLGGGGVKRAGGGWRFLPSPKPGSSEHLRWKICWPPWPRGSWEVSTSCSRPSDARCTAHSPSFLHTTPKREVLVVGSLHLLKQIVVLLCLLVLKGICRYWKYACFVQGG